MSCNAFLMRRVYNAPRSGNCECQNEEFQKKKGKHSETGKYESERILQEGCLGRHRPSEHCARDSPLKHGFLRRIIAPVSAVGGVTLSFVCPHCRLFPLEDYFWWVSSWHGDGNTRKKKQCNWWCGLWRPVRLEGSEQGLGHTGQ